MHFPCPSASRFLSFIGALSSLPIIAWSSPLHVRLEARHEQERGYDNERNFKTISDIYNLTVYPHQLPVLGLGAAGVPPGLFAQNVTGRVDPVGQFTNFVDSIEYFFALSPLPTSYPSGVAITGFEITEFTSACPEVAASVVYLYCHVANPCAPNAGVQLAPLKQVAFWRFDERGAVSKYDAWIPNLNNWVATTTGYPLANREFQLQSIRGLCEETMRRCTGPYQQWASVDECFADLSQRRYGDYNEAWGNNIVCRTIHIVLTGSRPDHHCPHVGPTGGGKCIDVPYPNDYFTDEQLYGDKAGETFKCPKKKCGCGKDHGPATKNATRVAAIEAS